MTLVRFKGRNHPQQVSKRGPRPEVDDRETAPEVFDPLHARFRFTIDVAASAKNAKLPRYYTIDDDGLAQSWAGERVWCNPPHSDIGPWLEKAWDEYASADLIVMLLPANRTEQRWWHAWVEPWRDNGRLTVEFLRGRLRFIAHDDTQIRPNQRPPYGCCLLIWGGP